MPACARQANRVDFAAPRQGSRYSGQRRPPLTFPAIPAMLSARSVQTSLCSVIESLALSSHKRGWKTPLNAVVIVQISMSRRYYLCKNMDEREMDNIRLCGEYMRRGGEHTTEIWFVLKVGTTRCRAPKFSEVSQNRSHHWYAAVDEKTGHAVRDDLEHWTTVAAEYMQSIWGVPRKKFGKLLSRGRALQCKPLSTTAARCRMEVCMCAHHDTE